jgi:hypothetical protein
VVIGSSGPNYEESIALSRFGQSCEPTWVSKIGLGGLAQGVAAVQGGLGAIFVGNIEVKGDYDIWIGCYSDVPWMDALGFLSFDMAGSNDEATVVAADGWMGAIIGRTEGAPGDVLLGTFTCGPGPRDSWWTYDGPAGGDDRGVDISLLPSGEIVVLAQVAGTLDNDQALLLYSRDGQLLDVDVDSFNDNPTGLAITTDNAIYTAAWNPESAPHAPGDIIVNKYTVSAVGVGPAETPAILRVGAPEPNPSSGPVVIPYELPTDGDLAIGIYDASGRLLRTLATGLVVGGRHEVVWDGVADTGESVASGVYFVRFDFGNRVERRQIVLAW